ncbi:MAG TPA: tetratricopeptide repeat protein, partial [Coleofasciculaceae cyanobacterium]
WVIFGLLWFVQPLNQFFWDSTYSITETLGVPPEMAGIGYALFREQSNILILGLVGVLWLFRRKEIKWYNQGNKLRKLQRYEDAIASFDKAIQIHSDFPYAWYNKACCYALQGNVPLAIETLQQAINLDPDQFREQAKTDSSFDTIQENQLFKNLIGE